MIIRTIGTRSTEKGAKIPKASVFRLFIKKEIALLSRLFII
jgi:hypothetical protein